MSTYLGSLKKYYGKIGLGKPFGIDLRTTLETIDSKLTHAFSLRRFTYNNVRLKYFYHPYNRTAVNERTVEIPLIRYLLKEEKAKPFLEVGNVLSHYQKVNHTIVDKYEQAQGIINQDILNFKPTHKYGLIVSISTLEHVGKDEAVKSRTKAIQALTHLQSLLSPGGKLIVTLPLGYNTNLDAHVFQLNSSSLTTTYFKRISHKNDWQQSTLNQIKSARYGSPYPWANVIALIMYQKPIS